MKPKSEKTFSRTRDAFYQLHYMPYCCILELTLKISAFILNGSPCEYDYGIIYNSNNAFLQKMNSREHFFRYRLIKLFLTFVIYSPYCMVLKCIQGWIFVSNAKYFTQNFSANQTTLKIIEIGRSHQSSKTQMIERLSKTNKTLPNRKTQTDSR